MTASYQTRAFTEECYLRMATRFPTNLFPRVYEQQVVLERMFVRDLSVYGTIRVNNRSYDKTVSIKFTIDQWKHSSTVRASYVMHYSDNNTDVFQFQLTVPRERLFGSTSLLFAICFTTDGREFWDNNYNRNYHLDIVEGRASIVELSTARGSSLNDSAFWKWMARGYQAVSRSSEQTRTICGLTNLGGTCYMNSILQSLSLTPLFTDQYTSNVNTRNLSVPKRIVANEFFNLLYLLNCGEYSKITPAPFKQIFGHNQPVYLANLQQDAHEFLLCLLEYLHQDLTRVPSSLLPTDGDHSRNIHSIITDLFYGMYRCTTTCLLCRTVSCNLEPFMCLTLPILSTSSCTLEDCFANLMIEEYLTDDAGWFCSRCQCVRNATRRIELHRLPKVLIIQLKRFQLNFEMQWIKNDTLVIYPEDDLNLQSSLYTLYSIVNHHGALDDGHYTTFSRDISTDQLQWFECDDERIEFLHTDKRSRNSKAYLLFYALKKPPEATFEQTL